MGKSNVVDTISSANGFSSSLILKMPMEASEWSIKNDRNKVFFKFVSYV